MTAVLALDPGSRRIGVAVSDPERRFGMPLAVIERRGDWLGELAALASERQADEVVVGLPLSLKGAEGQAAADARALAQAVGERLGVRVSLVDERLTTAAAERALSGAGVGGRRRRKLVDASAAALILQSYLEGSS